MPYSQTPMPKLLGLSEQLGVKRYIALVVVIHDRQVRRGAYLGDRWRLWQGGYSGGWR